MLKHIPKSEVFKFTHLPLYAAFILKNHLSEFTLVGIRFARELDLPMMKPLAKMPESDLVKLGTETNRQLLQALVNNTVENIIDTNIENFVSNKIVDSQGKNYLQNTDIIAEDIILAFYIRRKVFNHFLHSYSPNLMLHMLITNEVDYFTTQEHLLTFKAFISTKQ
ncbi:MAG: hypothetical protein HYX39_13695 [Bacteroidetes bacterium]|nr:hypothetical protein [Bacteroidota bacterium]